MTAALLGCAALVGCAPIVTADVPCIADGDCDLATGGACLAAPTGTRWCTYLDPSCESGREWSSVDTGDGLSGTCVPYAAPDPYAGGIAFVSDRDGNNEIYIMAADGSLQLALTHDPGDDLEPVWSPDGKHIAFRSSRSGTMEVYVMEPDGRGVVDISHGEASSARWSPDGRRVAFVSHRSGRPEVYVVAFDDSGDEHEPERLTDDGGKAPDWSPDGRRLVYVHDDTLVIASLDRTSRVPTTTGHSDEPAWDPAGEWIAFTYVEDAYSELFVLPTIGGSPTSVARVSGARVRAPVWSPDGSRLAYLVETGDGTRVWTAVIGQTPTPVELVDNGARPVWTREGESIVSSQSRGVDVDIVRMGVELGEVVDLSQHAGSDSSASLRR